MNQSEIHSRAVIKEFIKCGFTELEAVTHAINIIDEEIRLEKERKEEIYEMENQSIKDQEQLQKYV